MDHDNRQSANGDVTQSSTTAVTQQPVVQSTATADIMPAYTYAHTWPGYAVRMSTVFHQCCVIFTGRRKGILTKNQTGQDMSLFVKVVPTSHHYLCFHNQISSGTAALAYLGRPSPRKRAVKRLCVSG